MASSVLRNVRPWGGEAVDITMVDGRVAAIDTSGGETARPQDSVQPAIDASAVAPAEPAQTFESAQTVEPAQTFEPAQTVEPVQVIDGAGMILLPSFADVHLHLDSNRWGLPFKPHTAGPTLREHILADRAGWRDDAPIGQKTSALLGRVISRGVTKVRTYAQVDADAGFERIDGILEAREKYAEECDLTIMAFPQAGILADPPTARLLDQACNMDAIDVVGGIDPCEIDRDPKGHLDVVFELAEKYQMPVDMHLHEAGSLGAFSLDLIFERVRALGMQGKCTISHALVLGSNPESVVARLIDELVELDIAIATVSPRGVTQIPFLQLVDAGVRVGLGQDGIRDYWSPYGDGDMLSRVYQLGWTQDLKYDDDLRRAAYAATLGGRQVIDPQHPRPDALVGTPGVDVGGEADFVLIAGETLSSAIVDHDSARKVIRRGHLLPADL